jgi:hypothetical protein
MFYPPIEEEIKILMHRCKGLKSASARRLAEIGKTQREMMDDKHEFTQYVSTRMLIAAGSYMSAGFGVEQACKFAILNHFNADGGKQSERAKVGLIVQKGSRL